MKNEKPNCEYRYAGKKCKEHIVCPVCRHCKGHCPEHEQMAPGIECIRPRNFYVDPKLSAFIYEQRAAAS